MQHIMHEIACVESFNFQVQVARAKGCWSDDEFCRPVAARMHKASELENAPQAMAIGFIPKDEK